MTNYGQSHLVSGLDSDGKPRTIKVASDGTVQTSGVGTKIDAAVMPTGGVGLLGWLSGAFKALGDIFQLLSDRIPALSNGKIPVEVGSLNVTVGNASLEIANDAGNPIPISDAGGSITVDGSVSISNFPATQVVNTGLTQPLTDAQLRSAPVSVTQAFAPTSTLTNVASSATSVTLLAANNNRKTAIIINDSSSDLYVVLNASTASTTNYSLFLAAKVGNTPSFLAINGDDYSGEIRGIWSSANGFARITEVV